MARDRRRATTGLAAGLMLAVSVTAVACGDDDGSGSGAEADSATTQATSATTAGTADGPGEISVSAVDYAYEDLPASIAAGSELTLRNRSATELHELVAFELPDSETRAAAQLFELPREELERALGGPPVTVLLAPPGEAGFAAVGDATLTEPGRYVFACFVPTGADPQAYLEAAEASQGEPPQVAGGPPHFVRGMTADVTVR